MVSIAWGKKVSNNFKAEVIAISGRIGCDPSHLMSAMAFETGETFSPSIKSRAGGGATGLIQFLPSTARSLGTSTAALAAMTAESQLAFVEKYMTPFRGKLATLSDVYMAILFPNAVGKPSAHVLFRKPSKAYTLNQGLDAPPKDGKVTKAEAAAKVQAKLVRGMNAAFLG